MKHTMRNRKAMTGEMRNNITPTNRTGMTTLHMTQNQTSKSLKINTQNVPMSGIITLRNAIIIKPRNIAPKIDNIIVYPLYLMSSYISMKI